MSIAVHVGFVGAIVLADRRHLPPSDLQSMDVDLVKPEDLAPKQVEPPKPPEPPKQAELKPPEPPKQKAPPKSEAPKSEQLRSEPAKTARAPDPDQAESPPEPKPAAKPVKPDSPQGGPAGEGKSKLTPEEIASLRAQIQKCWKLPVGIPGIVGLEVILRVPFGSKGQLSGEPVLLQAPASERGPLLVGIAMNALKGCYPYSLPPAKYADWKTLDLKFTATGMAGLGTVQRTPAQAKR
ncbi:hypothetical protein [Pseudorhodoplanes sp.]|uniref:hypothetical protein n=1 Tax=Pseudorhodoplanes sp. TaxID=1934341 RepID=UPI002C5627E0|nr:hypothetical protein [Pseudorhodoplanes sp.]HWV53383.1 hypothetical protein [Pseudorhodoplanes sp.]